MIFRWNQIDTVIVVLSIAGIVVEKMNNGHILPINPTLIRVMRVLRIARGNNHKKFTRKHLGTLILFSVINYFQERKFLPRKKQIQRKLYSAV